jgi:hypothetical protein
MGDVTVSGVFSKMFLGLWSAFCSGRGWGKFYRGQYEAAIPDLEIAWCRERSPILVGGPLGQAYARVGRDEEALQVLQKLAAAVRAGSKELESDVGSRAAADGLLVLASLLDKRQRNPEAEQVRALVGRIRDDRT